MVVVVIYLHEKGQERIEYGEEKKNKEDNMMKGGKLWFPMGMGWWDSQSETLWEGVINYTPPPGF